MFLVANSTEKAKSEFRRNIIDSTICIPTPMVLFVDSVNVSFTNLESKLDFPTPESPTKTTK